MNKRDDNVVLRNIQEDNDDAFNSLNEKVMRLT
jgi:hypothetical protein